MNGKKLYKIKNGAMVTGVCNGLAAYFDVDVSLVRLAVVLLTCFTGIGIVPYIAAAIILPELNDSPYGNMNGGNVNNPNYNTNNTNYNTNNGSYNNPNPENPNDKDII